MLENGERRSEALARFLDRGDLHARVALPKVVVKLESMGALLVSLLPHPSRHPRQVLVLAPGAHGQ
jgi:hypothetical protein